MSAGKLSKLSDGVPANLVFLDRFGETVDILHSLDQPFTESSGASILQNLSFTQTRTNFVKVLH